MIAPSLSFRPLIFQTRTRRDEGSVTGKSKGKGWKSRFPPMKYPPFEPRRSTTLRFWLSRRISEEEGHRERKGLAVAEVASGGMERRRREWAPSLNEISHSRLIREISPWNEFHDSSWWSLGGFEKMAQVWPIAQPPVYFWRNSGHLFHGRILVGHGTLPISRQSFRSNWIITKLDGYLSCTLDNCVWDLVERLGKKKYKTRDVSRCFIFLTLKL